MILRRPTQADRCRFRSASGTAFQVFGGVVMGVCSFRPLVRHGPEHRPLIVSLRASCGLLCGNKVP